MRTITISKLKAHLSAEIKAVQNGEPVVILDRRHPVASLQAFESDDDIIVIESNTPYHYEDLTPLIPKNKDALSPLWEDRESR